MNDELIDVIMNFEIFDHFTRDGARNVLASGDIRQYAAGEMMIVENDPSTFVLLLLTGRALVLVQRGEDEHEGTEHGPGVILGDIGVLVDIPRSASVRAAESSTALKWTAQVYRKLLLNHTLPSDRIFRQLLKHLIDQEHALIDASVRPK